MIDAQEDGFDKFQHIQQVCLNGHQITDMYDNPRYRKSYCSDCGERTINSCQKCDYPIKGFHPAKMLYSRIPVPDYCERCGAAYPWIKKKKHLEQINLANTKKQKLLFFFRRIMIPTLGIISVFLIILVLIPSITLESVFFSFFVSLMVNALGNGLWEAIKHVTK
jgi:hypothetical protein